MYEAGFWKCVVGILLCGGGLALALSTGTTHVLLAVALWAAGIYYCITGGADIGTDAALSEGDRP